MKILLVDLEFDYGQKARGPNYIGRDGALASLTALGHEVEPFYFDRYFGIKYPQDLQSQLLNKVEIFQSKLVFFNCMHEAEFALETLDTLKQKVTTAAWFGDDQWRFDSYTSAYAPHFTFCVTTDPFALPKYRALGNTRAILSQWAAIDRPEVTETKPFQYEFDVGFVGMVHPYRKWFINELAKRGLKVFARGHGWEKGSLSDEEMYRSFRYAKINLNLSNSRSLDIRCLLSAPRWAISAYRAPKNASQIKARNFEIPFNGGFELTEYVPHLERYFDIGKELACFSNVDEAEQWIRYYLEHDEERESIRTAGCVRARREHSYKHRFERILEEIAKVI